MIFGEIVRTFRICVPLVSGIIGSVLLNINSPYVFVICGGLLLLSFVGFFIKSYSLRFIPGLVQFGLIFTLGISLVIVKTDIYKKDHFSKCLDKEMYVVGTVKEAPVKKSKSFKTILSIDYLISDREVKNVKGNLLTYFKQDSLMLNYGDQIIFKSNIKEVDPPANPAQFNYKHYLSLNNIYHQTYFGKNQFKKIDINKGNELVSIAYMVRDYLYHKLKENGVSGDELKVASALLLGYRELLDQDIIQSYSSAGAMHVLAVSGLHVGILFFILKISFGFLLRFKRGNYLLAFIIIGTLWLYALITGFSPSVLRSATMFSFIIIGEQLINRKVNIYNTLAISAVVLLCINPYLIFEVGFQLSYLAVLGIVYLQPKIYSLWVPNNFILESAWKITAVSFAAQIATFPLGLYYFHQFPVYFFVSNLVVIPAATIILYLGVFLFITSSIGGISIVIGKILGGIIFLLNETVAFTRELPFSLIEEISITRLDAYLLYLFIISLLVFLYYKKVKYFFFAGTTAFLILMIQILERADQVDRKEFTTYSIRDETAFEFISGNKTYLFSSDQLYQDKAQMLFNIKHNWYEKNITKVKILDLDSLSFRDDLLFVDNGVIKFYDQVFMYLTKENVHLIKDLKPELIVVSLNNYKLLYDVEDFIPSGTKLLFDSSIKSYYFNYWKKRLINQRCISTSEMFYTIKF